MVLIHRFLPGLRFDSTWQYQVQSPSRTRHWARLPMNCDAEAFDPQGAWWCVLRCAAVLSLRSQDALTLPAGLPPHPHPEEVAQALRRLLPGWRVAADWGTRQAPVEHCTKCLDGGGSALMLLQPLGGPVGVDCWAWVTGVEMQVMAPNDLSTLPALPSARMGLHPRSLLVAPFGQPVVRGCGYGARVHRDAEGLCRVEAVSGQRFQNGCLGLVTVQPP